MRCWPWPPPNLRVTAPRRQGEDPYIPSPQFETELSWTPAASTEVREDVGGGARSITGTCGAQTYMGDPKALLLLIPRGPFLAPVATETPAETHAASVDGGVSSTEPQGSDSELDR